MARQYGETRLGIQSEALLVPFLHINDWVCDSPGGKATHTPPLPALPTDSVRLSLFIVPDTGFLRAGIGHKRVWRVMNSQSSSGVVGDAWQLCEGSVRGAPQMAALDGSFTASEVISCN